MIETFKTILIHPIYGKLIAAAFWLVLVFLVRIFVNKTLNKSISNTDKKYKARKAFNLISLLFFLVVVLFIFRENLGQIGVTIGLAGAGIAFALQEIIVSLAGWLYISISSVISTGDRVKIGDVKGDIIDIGMLTTTLMETGDWVDGDLYNGKIFTITNSYILKQSVSNYSAVFPFLWDELSVPIRTECDVEAARAIFTKVLDEVCGEYSASSEEKWSELADKYRVEEAQVKPMVTLKFDSNFVTYTLRYVVDYKKRRSTKDQISTKVLMAIAAEDGLEIATSTMEVTMIK